MTIDLLPTVARLIGAPLPPRQIDGLDITPLLTGEPSARSPHEVLYFYWLNRLDALRSGQWKLHLPHDYPSPESVGADGRPGKIVRRETGLALYDLDADIGETTDVADRNPAVVARLMPFVEQARADLGDTATMRDGAGLREPGRLADPKRE
jgi:arylsulfatase A